MPVYETHPGWREDISGITSWGELPEATRAYCDRISNLVGAPFDLISTGPAREATIHCIKA